MAFSLFLDDRLRSRQLGVEEARFFISEMQPSLSGSSFCFYARCLCEVDLNVKDVFQALPSSVWLTFCTIALWELPIENVVSNYPFRVLGCMTIHE